MEDAALADQLFEGSPVAIEKMLEATLVAAHACGELGDETRQRSLMDEAAQDFVRLKEFSQNQRAVLGMVYYALVSEDREAEDFVCSLLQEAIEQDVPFHPYAADYCCQIMFRRGRYADGIEAYRLAMENSGGLPRSIEYFQPLFEDSVSRSDQLTAFRKDLDNLLGSTPKIMLGWDWSVLRLLGAGRDDVDVLRVAETFEEGYRDIPRWNEAWGGLPKFMKNEWNEEQLLEVAASRRSSLIYAYTGIAINALADGQRDRAIDFFRKAVDTGSFEQNAYGWSQAFLERLKDPSFPSWCSPGSE
jgi:hypothetical protein